MYSKGYMKKWIETPQFGEAWPADLKWKGELDGGGVPVLDTRRNVDALRAVSVSRRDHNAFLRRTA